MKKHKQIIHDIINLIVTNVNLRLEDKVLQRLINSQFMRDQFTGHLGEENFKQKNHVLNSFICELCIKESWRRNSFYDYMKCKHSNIYYDLKDAYKCDLCNNELMGGRSFKKYIKQKHSGEIYLQTPNLYNQKIIQQFK